MNTTTILLNVPVFLLLGISIWSLTRTRARPVPPRAQPLAPRPERWLPLDAFSSQAACTAVVAELPQGWQLSYFAADHRSPTDPGGYVEVQHTAPDVLLRKVANYGWSSYWVRVTPEDVESELHRNRAAQPRGVRLSKAIWLQSEGDR